MAGDYDQNSIQVLDDLVHIRTRPGMYIGSTDADGVFQVFVEVLDNSLDEYLAGHATSIEVELNTTKGWIQVRDDGRGIPVEAHEKTGISTLTTVLTTLQSGGKFNNQTYAISAGLHGVGIKATNALSQTLHASVWRKGKHYFQQFKQGVPQSDVIQEPSRDKERKHGTEIYFEPDPAVFGKHKLDLERVKTALEELAFLCPGLQLYLKIDEQEWLEYTADGGLTMLLAQQSVGLQTQGKVFQVTSDDGTIDVALLWTLSEDDSEYWWSYCNLKGTPELGTHVTGVKRAITKALGDINDKRVNTNDFRAGLYATVHVKVHDPLFKGQTKSRLQNSDVESSVYELVLPALTKWLGKNWATAKAIIERAVHLRKAREQYQQLKAATSNITVTKKDARGVLPGKLVEAPYCTVEERELFVVEGDSAGGSAVAARDPHCQEVLPLRGKILNAQRASMTNVLKNEEIQSLITATGVQIDPLGKANDLSKLRVGKLLLLCDADPDGCFRGNTKVRLLDGTTPTFKQLLKRFPKGEEFWVYSLDTYGNLVPGKAHSVRVTKHVAELIKVKLDNGVTIQCTPDHLFCVKNPAKHDSRVVLDGLPYIRADLLQPGDSLQRSLYYHNNHFDRPMWGGWFLHQAIWYALATKGDKIRYASGNYELHHKDGDRFNNNPDNIELLLKVVHRAEHNHLGEYNKSEKHKQRVKDLHKQGYYDLTAFKSYNNSDQHKLDISNAWKNGKYDSIFQKLSKAGGFYASLVKAGFDPNAGPSAWNAYRPQGVRCWDNISDVDWRRIKQLSKAWCGFEYPLVKRTKASYPNQMISKFVRVAKQVLESGLELNEANYEQVRLAKIQEGWDRACKWATVMPKLGISTSGLRAYVDSYNHAVVSIKRVVFSSPVAVYDMTVDNYHNFALESGVFVHNCHISTLILSFIMNYMWELVQQGRVYVVHSPLFRATNKTGAQYWYADSIQELETQSGVTADKLLISRLKGHGECDAQELKYYAMDPTTRKLVKLEYSDNQYADFIRYMGDDSSARKDILGING